MLNKVKYTLEIELEMETTDEGIIKKRGSSLIEGCEMNLDEEVQASFKVIKADYELKSTGSFLKDIPTETQN